MIYRMQRKKERKKRKKEATRLTRGSQKVLGKPLLMENER